MNAGKEKGAQEACKAAVYGASECGMPHDDCPNTWKGSCDREAGHSGSHHCDKCNSAF